MKSMNLIEKLRVNPGTKVDLRDHDPDATPGFKGKPDVDAILLKTCSRMAELQYLMYAENKRALLIVLQAPDTGGKDGTIRHVMTGLNPMGVHLRARHRSTCRSLAPTPAPPPKAGGGVESRL